MNNCNHWKKLAATLGGLLPITILLLYNLMTKGYWWRRLVNVYNYQNDPQGIGFQTRVAVTDIADGGWFGKGLGMYNFPSTYDWRSYRYMMPNTLSEYILQITGREFGIMGLVTVCILFCLLGFSAYRLIGRIKGNVNSNFALYILAFLLLAAVIGIIRTCNVLPFVPSMGVPFVAFGPKLMFGSMVSLGIIAGLALRCQQGEDGDDNIGIMEPSKTPIPVRNNLDSLQMGNERYTLYCVNCSVPIWVVPDNYGKLVVSKTVAGVWQYTDLPDSGVRRIYGVCPHCNRIFWKYLLKPILPTLTTTATRCDFYSAC